MTGDLMGKQSSKAIFLDRDGVINLKLPEDRYVCDPGHFQLLEGVAQALSMFNEMGYLVVVVTNQRGIARGLMNSDDLCRVHRHMEDQLGLHGVSIDAIYYCPHSDSDGCSCRKPQPGMLIAAQRDLNISLSDSYTVGDSESDVEAGRRAGTKTVRIAEDHDVHADFTFSSLLEFALYLQAQDSDGCGHT